MLNEFLSFIFMAILSGNHVIWPGTFYDETMRPEFRKVSLFERAKVLVTGKDQPGFCSPFTVPDCYSQRHAVASTRQGTAR